MKIMMLCDYPMTPSEINGGVAAAGFNLVQALLAISDVEIVVAGFWPEFKGASSKTIHKGRLKVVRCPAAAPRAHLRNYNRERKLFRQIIADEQPDIIHAQGEGIYASVAVFSGLPNVYTIHGIRLKELEMGRSDIGEISYFLRRRLIQSHHRKASNIVAINRYTEQAIAAEHSARVRIIHNAVDESFFELHSTNEKEPGRLLQVGGVRSRKDIPTLIKAVSQLQSRSVPVSLDIVGPNSDDSLPGVEAAIREHSLGQTVRINGLVSEAELNDLYAAADIFVMSSVEESSPISIVQAMAAGLPVVSTDVGGIAEMVAESENSFLVKPGDADEIANRLEMLITDRERRNNFASRSRMIAVEDWSTESVARKTLSMYEEIISDF